MKHALYLFLSSGLLLLLLSSCPPVPGEQDVRLLNDRTAPVIVIDSPAGGGIYGDRVEVTGCVLPDEDSGFPAVELAGFSYRKNNQEPAVNIEPGPEGNFLFAFFTSHFSGDIEVLLEAVDTAGNTGQAALLLHPPVVTAEPTVAPLQEPDPGTFFWVPSQLRVTLGAVVAPELHFNSGTQRLASYGISIYYDTAYLAQNNSGTYNSISAGVQGFVTAINSATAGGIVVSGFDVSGTGPGESLHILTCHLRGIGRGASTLMVSPVTATDPNYNNIGTPRGINTEVRVE